MTAPRAEAHPSSTPVAPVTTLTRMPPAASSFSTTASGSYEGEMSMGKLSRLFFTGRSSRKSNDRPESEVNSLWRAFSDGGNRKASPVPIPGSDRLANMPDKDKQNEHGS